MSFIKVRTHFVMKRDSVSEVVRLKPKRRGNSSPLVKTSGNKENRYNMGGSRNMVSRRNVGQDLTARPFRFSSTPGYFILGWRF